MSVVINTRTLTILLVVLLNDFVVGKLDSNFSSSDEDTIFSQRILTKSGSPFVPRQANNFKYICQEDNGEIERSNKNLGIRCRCPMIEAPVCGSDNVTYRNRCFMHCRAMHATDVYHRYRLTLKKFGEC